MKTPEKLKNKAPSQKFVSWAVFLTTIVVTFLAAASATFPALLIRSFGGAAEFTGINPFLTGIWTGPILIANVIVFGLAILYFKNKIPQIIKKSINFIFNFEIPKSVAVLALVVLLGIYIVFTVQELFEREIWDDYGRIKGTIESWNISYQNLSPWVRFTLLAVSNTVFENAKVIPLMASTALLLLTYLFTVQITKKRFAGIVAMVVLMQSGTFQIFDTAITYTNFWILFYLFSLYLLNRAWPASPLPFFFSILSKAMSGGFLPVTLFFIYDSIMSRKKKILASIMYGAIIAAGTVVIFTFPNVTGGVTEFDNHDFWKGYNAISYQLRYDGMALMFLVPLTVGLFIASKKGIVHANSLMVLIMVSLLIQPLLVGFGTNNSEPYRFMPFVVFFAIGVGVLLSKQFRPKIKPQSKLETKSDSI